MLSLHTGYDTAYLTDAVGSSDYYTGGPGSLRDTGRAPAPRRSALPARSTAR